MCPCLSSAVVLFCLLIVYYKYNCKKKKKSFSVLLYKLFLITFDIVQCHELIFRGTALYKSYCAGIVELHGSVVE